MNEGIVVVDNVVAVDVDVVADAVVVVADVLFLLMLYCHCRFY